MRMEPKIWPRGFTGTSDGVHGTWDRPVAAAASGRPKMCHAASRHTSSAAVLVLGEMACWRWLLLVRLDEVEARVLPAMPVSESRLPWVVESIFVPSSWSPASMPAYVSVFLQLSAMSGQA